MAAVSNLKNMALCLFATCFVCSGVLGGVYAVTKAPIEETNAAILSRPLWQRCSLRGKSQHQSRSR